MAYRIEIACEADGRTWSEPINSVAYETPHLALAFATRMERKWAAEPNALGVPPWLLVIDNDTGKEVILEDAPASYFRPIPQPFGNFNAADDDIPF